MNLIKDLADWMEEGWRHADFKTQGVFHETKPDNKHGFCALGCALWYRKRSYDMPNVSTAMRYMELPDPIIARVDYPKQIPDYLARRMEGNDARLGGIITVFNDETDTEPPAIAAWVRGIANKYDIIKLPDL